MFAVTVAPSLSVTVGSLREPLVSRDDKWKAMAQAPVGIGVQWTFYSPSEAGTAEPRLQEHKTLWTAMSWCGCPSQPIRGSYACNSLNGKSCPIGSAGILSDSHSPSATLQRSSCQERSIRGSPDVARRLCASTRSTRAAVRPERPNCWGIHTVRYP